MTNATVKKVTVADNFAMVKAFLEQNGASDEMVAFIVDRADKAKKKSSGSRKPTERQLENDVLKDKIYEYLSSNAPSTISGLIASIPDLNGLATQRVTPMLCNDARFTTVKVGKSNCYTIVKEQ